MIEPLHALTPTLSVVVPLYDEEANVHALLERLLVVLETLAEPFEVICVDDGSTDATLARLREEATRHAAVEIISKPRNEGQHAAVVDGFRRARGRWIITLDADLQNPPEEIPRVVAELRAGHDVVGTYREIRCDPALRRLGSRLANGLYRRLSGLPIRDVGCMLRGYSADVAARIVESAGPDAFVPALALRLARSPVEIAVSHERRAAGESRYGVLRLVRLAVRLARTARRDGRPPRP